MNLSSSVWTDKIAGSTSPSQPLNPLVSEQLKISLAPPYRQTIQHRAEPSVTHLGTHKCQSNPYTQQSTKHPEGEHQCPTVYTNNLIPEMHTEKREAITTIGNRQCCTQRWLSQDYTQHCKGC